MKVSVSVTTYEHEPWIAQALDSILAQEVDFAWEIVIGDDCSRDRTREIVLEYAARHPDLIRTVLPDENLGDGGKPMFAATLEECRGEYIAYLDGDDYWTATDKLARQVRFLDAHPRASMCHHNVRWVRDDPAGPARTHSPPGQGPFTPFEEILERCAVASCSPMFRREALLPLPPWYGDVPFGDWPLYVAAAMRGPVGYIDEVMGAYRVHERGLWSARDGLERARQTLAFYETLAGVAPLSHDARLERLVGRQHFKLARECTLRAEALLGARHVWRALRSGAVGTEVTPSELAGVTLKLARMLVWRSGGAEGHRGGPREHPSAAEPS